VRLAGRRYVLPASVSINLKQSGENRFEFLSRRPEKKDREPSACAAVGLMTGSDDTVLDDVSVRLTPSVMMFPLT
jgi:hypothetical protein